MYEYKCSNESCSQVWTIKEGDISCVYLTCPFCKKGRGQFLRQLKSETLHEDILKLALKQTEDDYVETVNTKVEDVKPKKAKKGIEVKDENQTEKPKTRGRKKANTEEVEEKSKKKVNKKKAVAAESVDEVKEQESSEEDIFTRIIKKRQIEEEFRKNSEQEDVDILEISANSMEEIEDRIKEFEEYYYIKVLDRSIQKQGKRLNCIIKYCRK